MAGLGFFVLTCCDFYGDNKFGKGETRIEITTSNEEILQQLKTIEHYNKQ